MADHRQAGRKGEPKLTSSQPCTDCYPLMGEDQGGRGSWRTEQGTSRVEARADVAVGYGLDRNGNVRGGGSGFDARQA
jgi:hypothetical protein